MRIFARKETLSAVLETDSTPVELEDVEGKQPLRVKGTHMPKQANVQAIEWATPPPAANGRHGQMNQFVEILKTRPNEWAIFKRNAKNAVVVTSARKRHPQTEWTSRRNADGTFTIYGRFVQR